MRRKKFPEDREERRALMAYLLKRKWPIQDVAEMAGYALPGRLQTPEDPEDEESRRSQAQFWLEFMHKEQTSGVTQA